MRRIYNSERKKLRLPEYGRHIHDMVDYLLAIEDRAERNRQTRAVIAVMGNLNPVLRDSAEYTHKLWDHLFTMSDFKLDVDSPYPIPTAATLNPVPARLAYPSHRILHKQYGYNIQRMIRSLIEEPDQQSVKATVNNIARYMRTKSFEYNEEHPNNEAIAKDIRKMSENRINLDENAINNIRSDYKQSSLSRPRKGAFQQNRNGKQQKNGKPVQAQGKSHRDNNKKTR